jgi:CheY-like chemotaxis protein
MAYRILLVEDDLADVRLVQIALETAGVPFEMEVVDNGDLAIQLVSRIGKPDGPPPADVMLLDLNLPRASGHDVIKAVRENPNCMGMPVIVLSTTVDPGEIQRVESLGVTRFCCKPMRIEGMIEFGRTVGKILSKQD